ncbi:MAG: GGDEF domain-containing protein [Candidatus Gastranaerophilales bacterium]|nr:GGDEF domain-containing protein [Candidatus Gastranaerophilales bacterium]
MAKSNIDTNKDLLIKKMQKTVAYISLFLLLSALVFVFLSLKKEYAAARMNLLHSVMQTASNMREHIKNEIFGLKVLSSEFTSKNTAINDAEVSKFLSQNLQKDNYYRLFFAYPDRKTVILSKKDGKVSYEKENDSKCLTSALSGNPCFAGTTEENDAESKYVNTYYVPVVNAAGEVTGAIGADIDTDVFKRILFLNSYNGQAYSHVIDSDGNYIIKSQSPINSYINFFDAKINYLKNSREKIQDSLKSENSGTFLFKVKDGKFYVGAFAFIGNNNSFVLTDVPLDVLMFHSNILLGGLAAIFLTIWVLMLALLRYSNSLYRKNEYVIYNAAFNDEITEGYNKTKFLLDAQDILVQSKDDNYALISVDIANFKALNELLGYQFSNKIIKGIYTIIQRNLSKGSIMARDFSSTFVILYKYASENQIPKTFLPKLTYEIEKYNEDVMNRLQEEKGNENKKISRLNPVYGIYLIEDKNSDLVQMCENASFAKRNIKNANTQNYQFYDDGLKEKLQQDKSLEEEMIAALENKQFRIFLQPKIDIVSMKIAGAEALVRWFHSTRGIIPPREFLTVFEKNGFITKLDKYVWQQACNFISIRQVAGETIFPVSVNVSPLHFNNDGLVDELLALTDKYRVDPKYIGLEIEEKCIAEDKNNRVKEVITKLKEAGFTISLDNFGTGFSSVNILKTLPIDELKLDRTFISTMSKDEKNQVLINSIVEMAKQLDIKIVAEGIETPEQAEFIKQAGCNIAQGFLFGRPMDENNFIRTFLSNKKEY